MSVIQKTLRENYLYFIRELGAVDRELKGLPRGNISAKKIKGAVYHYRQWREGGKIKSVSLGREIPAGLVQALVRKKELEARRREILENINVIAGALDVGKITFEEIMRVFAENGVKAILIGSHCLPVFSDRLGLQLPTIRTQDVDFLFSRPYRGKAADLDDLLGGLGFDLGFNADGSTFFKNGEYRVEFLTPEKGTGGSSPVSIEALGIKAEPLRYLGMLEEIVPVAMDGYTFNLPAPWIYAFHKLLISGLRKSADKREKDLFQALSLLKAVVKNPDYLKHAAK